VYTDLEFIDNDVPFGSVGASKETQAQGVIAVDPRGRGQIQLAFRIRRQGSALPCRPPLLVPDMPNTAGWNLLPVDVHSNFIARSQSDRPEPPRSC
jgi:hypothetical protein